MNIIYETYNFCLIPFLDVDLEKSNYRNWMHDQEVCEFNSHGLFPYTKADELSWRKKVEDNEIICWAIVAKTNFKLNTDTVVFVPRPGWWVGRRSDKERDEYHIHIGNISLQSINWINRSAEFAIVIGEKEYWRKGIATDALRILIEHGFDKLNLHRIWSGTAKSNIGMGSVFKKLGMHYEGSFRDGVFLRGEYVDVLSYAILSSDLSNWYEPYTKE